MHIGPRPVLRTQLQAAEEVEMKQSSASCIHIQFDALTDTSNLPMPNVEDPEHFIWCNLGHLKCM